MISMDELEVEIAFTVIQEWAKMKGLTTEKTADGLLVKVAEG